MSSNSSIEWTEATWNPVVGCTKVSAGCKYCYAERMSWRLRAMAVQARRVGVPPGRKEHYRGVVDGRGRWTQVVAMVEEALEDPIRWRKPRRVFVNSMSDLFHPAVGVSYIRRVFDVMNTAQQHCFQILTKRPERAAELAPELWWSSNIWMGTSVENTAAIERVDRLREIPARIRFLSLEPLLGPLAGVNLAGIQWVIVGGESGPGARPVDSAWVRDLRDQAVSADVAFFFKQWGGRNKKASGRLLDGRTWDQYPTDKRSELDA